MARWSALNPWKAVAGWLVFVIASIAIGSAVGLHEASNLDQTTGQSGTAAHWLHDSGLEAPDTENVLVTPLAGRLDVAQARAALAAASVSMRGLPKQVAAVSAPILARSGLAKDASAMTVQVTLRHDADVAPLLKATKAVQASYPGIRVEEVGSTSLNDAVNNQVASDLSSAATISLPVTLVILLVAFGAIIAAGVPLLLALSAVGAATGLSSLASHVVPDSGTTSSMILLMGMAVGVDYSLFFVRRAREESRRGASRLDAVEIAAETSGHSVLVSGMAVIVSMVGLYLVGNVTFSSLATGSIIVIGVAVLGSLTVLPALLVKLGRRIDRPRVPVLWRITSTEREPRLWPALLRPSLNRPVRTLTVSVLALAALALPALSLTLHSDSAVALPDSIAAKHTLERLTAAFPNENATQRVVVTAAAADAPAVVTALDRLAGTAAASRLFLAEAPDVRGSADGTVHVLRLDAPFDQEAPQARKGIAELRGSLVADAVGSIHGAQWAVGGDTATSMDGDHQLSTRLPWVIGFVVLLTMLIMGWVFRSIVIALTTAFVNLLSAGASFGVLVLVFQHTWAESLLGFHSTGAVVNWIPLFTFAVLFGLSMDYHVFVISRIREAVDSGHSTREAIKIGLTGSAGAVTSAAFVMVSVFSIFASLHMVEMKELGVGLAVAVLVDALVVRVIVLPSLMTILGRWNWWPGRVPPTRSQAKRQRQPSRSAARGTSAGAVTEVRQL